MPGEPWNPEVLSPPLPFDADQQRLSYVWAGRPRIHEVIRGWWAAPGKKGGMDIVLAL